MRKKITVLGITFAMMAAFAGCSADAGKEVKATEAVTTQVTTEAVTAEQVTAEESKKKEDEAKVSSTEKESKQEEAESADKSKNDTVKPETQKSTEASKTETKDAQEVKQDTGSGAEAADKAEAAEAPKEDESFSKDMGIGGTWYGEIYTRISADITASGEGYSVVLSWAGSAVDAAVWTMTLTYDSSTGKYNYSNAEVKTRTYAEDGTYTEEVESTGGSGYFHLVDGKTLCWNDNALINDYGEITLAIQ